jgi:hypothetical protein
LDSIRNLLLLFITLPAIVLTNTYLWSFQRQNDIVWYILLPLSVMPLVASDIPAVRTLALMGIAGGLMHLISAWYLRSKGQQII